MWQNTYPDYYQEARNYSISNPEEWHQHIGLLHFLLDTPHADSITLRPLRRPAQTETHVRCRRRHSRVQLAETSQGTSPQVQRPAQVS